MQNIEYWLDLGMTVLNVAAMVVPCLNPIMLTLGAAQIMGSVFEGISAWEEGDNEEAAAQLESVLLNIVTVAAVGGGAVALKASGFVDAMQSIVKDGKDYLWNATLKDHASPVSIGEDLEPMCRAVTRLTGVTTYVSRVLCTNSCRNAANGGSPTRKTRSLSASDSGQWRRRVARGTRSASGVG